MSRATAAALPQREPRPAPTTCAERPPCDPAFGVTAPYADHLDDVRPFAVTSRIGSIVRTEHYPDRAAAVRGAAQARRDLAILAAGPGRPR
jgi:hypothetical protein